MVNFLGKLFNALYKALTRFSIVPNLEGDKAGLANMIFVRAEPILRRGKELKATNKKLYLLSQVHIEYNSPHTADWHIDFSISAALSLRKYALIIVAQL